MTKMTPLASPFIILSLLFSGSPGKAMEEMSNSEGTNERNNRGTTPFFPIKDRNSSELDLSQEDGFNDLCADLKCQPAPPDSPRTRYFASLGEKKLQEHRQILLKAQIVREADHNISTEDPELFKELATHEAVSRSRLTKGSSPESRSTHALRLPLASITAETVQESSQSSTRVSSRSVLTPRTPKNSPKPPFLTESPKEEQGPSPRTFGLTIKNALLRLGLKKPSPQVNNQESPKSDEDQE